MQVRISQHSKSNQLKTYAQLVLKLKMSTECMDTSLQTILQLAYSSVSNYYFLVQLAADLLFDFVQDIV